MRVQSLRIPLPCGLVLHCRHWPGADTGHPSLLLHGFANDAAVWDELPQRLAATGPVYALDFRGHGDSDWDPQARYDHFTLAQDIGHCVGALGLRRPHIIGHSLGARVALLWLAASGCDVASLTVVDTGPDVNQLAANKVRADAEAMPTAFGSIQAWLDHLRGIYLLAESNALERWGREAVRQRNDGLWQSKTDPAFTAALWHPQHYRGLRAPLAEQLWQAWRELRCPTLLLRGQISAILKRNGADAMLACQARARLVTIAQAGHALMLDNPRDFADAVARFLLEVEPQVPDV